MMRLLTFFLVVHISQVIKETGSSKDILHGFLSGQLSSALGDYQVGALKQQFQSFKNTMKRYMTSFKEEIKADFEIKGISTYMDDFELFRTFYDAFFASPSTKDF